MEKYLDIIDKIKVAFPKVKEIEIKIELNNEDLLTFQEQFFKEYNQGSIMNINPLTGLPITFEESKVTMFCIPFPISTLIKIHNG